MTLILKSTYHLQAALFGSYSDRGTAHQPNCATAPLYRVMKDTKLNGYDIPKVNAFLDV